MQDSNTTSDVQTNKDSSLVAQESTNSNQESLQQKDSVPNDSLQSKNTAHLESNNQATLSSKDTLTQEESEGIPESIFNEISAITLHDTSESHKIDSPALTQQENREKINKGDSKNQREESNQFYLHTDTINEGTTQQDTDNQQHNPNENLESQENTSTKETLNTTPQNEESQENTNEKHNQEKTQVHEELTNILQNIEVVNDPFIEEIIYDKKTQKRKKKKHKRFKKTKINWSYVLYSKRLFASITILACFIGLYTGYLLFGSTSLEVLWRLQNKRNDIAKEVEQHRLENAQLQKKVLELQALEPQ